MGHLGTSEDHLAVGHPYHGVDRHASCHHVPASSVDHPSCDPSSDRHDLRGLCEIERFKGRGRNAFS